MGVASSIPSSICSLIAISVETARIFLSRFLLWICQNFYCLQELTLVMDRKYLWSYVLIKYLFRKLQGYVPQVRPQISNRGRLLLRPIYVCQIEGQRTQYKCSKSSLQLVIFVLFALILFHWSMFRLYHNVYFIAFIWRKSWHFYSIYKI